MRFDTRSTRVQLLALALAVGAAACAKKDATTDEVAGGTVDTSGAITTPAFKVADVNLGRSIDAEKKIKDGTKEFHVRDTIYASVTTDGSAPSATLRARWTFEDGQAVDESSRTIAPNNRERTEFHISKPNGWPAGKYKLEVFLNDQSVETKTFEVQAR